MIKYFLPFIAPWKTLSATCSACGTETVFNGFVRIRTDDAAHHYFEFQCQGCGKLTFSDENCKEGVIVALSERCGCGGQFRRDKNIFCPSCHHRKDASNSESDTMYVAEAEIELLESRHGK